MRHLEIGLAQLRSITNIARKSWLLCVNIIPFRYGYCAGVKASGYGVIIA